MDTTTTSAIVEGITRGIVEHRLRPGEKLVEQRLADEFGVSRTLVRQALYRLSQNRLIRIEPARGAFVSAPSIEEAQQVFAVRRILESAMTRTFIAQATDRQVKKLQQHIAIERAAIRRGNVAVRTELLGDFHVCMAQLMGNAVLAEMLTDLIARCALIALMYQSGHAASHSHEEHQAIVAAIHARDAELAVELMDAHLSNVEHTLTFHTATQ
jgi:DNA-binding GntR family transcriptional regulator